MLIVNLVVRLYHVDVFIQLTIEECRLDNHLVNEKVVLGCQTKHDPNRSELGNRCEGLVVVDAVFCERLLATIRA